MNTHYIDINLPPLPPPFKKAVYATSANTKSVRDGVEMGGYEKEPPLFDDAQMHEYARAAIEADRKRRSEPVDKGPWKAGVNRSDKRTFIESDDFTHDVRLYVDGDFADQDEKLAYALGIADQLNAAPQPAEPVKVPSDDLAHEIWAAAQTVPGKGIEDAVGRVAALLAKYGQHAQPAAPTPHP